MTSRMRIFGVILPVPGPIARLADKVRRNYDPNFRLIAPHVTVLPPRPLPLTRRQVREAVLSVAERTAPLRLRLGRVGTFRPVRPVVFLGIQRGIEDLRRLHRRLARPPLRAREAFPYVPHLTLAQDLDENRLREALTLGRGLLRSADAPRTWPANALVVVERRSPRRWITLKPVPLSGPPARGGGSTPDRNHRGGGR
jgi:2'-5' RNA ligase